MKRSFCAHMPAARGSALAAAILTAACAQQPVSPSSPVAPTPPAQSAVRAAPPLQREAQPPPDAARPASSQEAPARIEHGRISMYGGSFAGRTTASGERFDPDALTMAHRTLPFGTLVRVTNAENGRSVELRVNDRGPFVAGRIADLSPAAARALGMVRDGVVDATIEVLAPPD